MNSPRFHPFGRLVICAMGMLALLTIVGAVFKAVAFALPLYTGHPLDVPIDQLAKRYELPLTVLFDLAMLAWIAFCRVRFDKRAFFSLGLRRAEALPNAARGAIAGMLSIALLWSLLWLTGAISVNGWNFEAFSDGVGHVVLSLLGWVAVFVVVGVSEEILFRGYLLHNLSNWFGYRWALLGQAALFAVVHLTNVAGGTDEAKRAAFGALPSLFLIAVFFALSARKTGSLWFPIGFHFAWNFCLGTVFSLPVSGIETFHLLDVRVNEVSWLSGGAFGAEGSWLLIPIIAALIYYIAKAPDHPQSLLDLAPLEAAPVATAQIAPLEEEELEEDRESRFSTKFGSAQGFSADTLNELRDLQEAREKVQRDAAEAAKREAIEVASLAAKPVTAPVEVIVPPVFASGATPTQVVETVKPVEVDEELVAAPVAESPVTESPVAVAEKPMVVKPIVVKPVETAAEKPSERPVVKKSAPRW